MREIPVECDPSEFLPLPYFLWLSRPDSLPLDVDEIATALFLSHGDLEPKVPRRSLKALRQGIRLMLPGSAVPPRLQRSR